MFPKMQCLSCWSLSFLCWLWGRMLPGCGLPMLENPCRKELKVVFRDRVVCGQQLVGLKPSILQPQETEFCKKVGSSPVEANVSPQHLSPGAWGCWASAEDPGRTCPDPDPQKWNKCVLFYPAKFATPNAYVYIFIMSMSLCVSIAQRYLY